MAAVWNIINNALAMLKKTQAWIELNVVSSRLPSSRDIDLSMQCFGGSGGGV